jgi:hypothetical protein
MALDPISTMVAKMRAKQAQGLGQGPQLPTVREQQVLRPTPRVAPQPAPAPAQPAPQPTPLEQFAQPAPRIPALAPQTAPAGFESILPMQVPAAPISAPLAAPQQPIPAEASAGPIEGMSIPPAVLMAAEEIQRRDPSIRFGRAIDEAAAILGLA